MNTKLYERKTIVYLCLDSQRVIYLFGNEVKISYIFYERFDNAKGSSQR